jgi:cyclopropane fatty-acyl-phospholipid synthase-like methyltransferase
MQDKKKIGPTTKGAIEPHNAAYDPVDKLFRQIFGKFPSISNSWPGDYGKATLEAIQKAQVVKYDNYFKYLGLKENSGMKIFEIGPGWGPFSDYCIAKGVDVTSICPGKTQYEYLKNSGHNVHRAVWQEFTPDNGPFDAIVTMGSPEHFASPTDYIEGKQDQVYRNFFDYCSGLLKPGGRIGGQFMTFNHKECDYYKLQVEKEGTTDEEQKNYHIGLLLYRYPEAWLPRDAAHFISCAKPGEYRTIKVVDGREHYIWTARGWKNQFDKLLPISKWFTVARLMIRTLYDKDFSYWAKAFWKQSNRLCFEKGWMGHEFYFVEKV